eukprot:10495169-Heterocapsa_arctica.AAC.1
MYRCLIHEWDPVSGNRQQLVDSAVPTASWRLKASPSACPQRHTSHGTRGRPVWHHRGGDREARAVRSVRVIARLSGALLEAIGLSGFWAQEESCVVAVFRGLRGLEHIQVHVRSHNSNHSCRLTVQCCESI